MEKYVIIHSHGSSYGLYDDAVPQKAIFTTDDIHKLERNRKIKCVIIIACSTAGSTKDGSDNFACALSRMINKKGVVVGGRVKIGGYSSFFRPTDDFSYMDYPWIIYRNGRYLDGKLPKTITMKIVYDYLVKHNYI